MAFKSRIGKFSKFGKSRHLAVVLFIGIFAGLGTYLFVQSQAAPANPIYDGTVNVYVRQLNPQGADIGGAAGVRIQIRSDASAYTCQVTHPVYTNKTYPAVSGLTDGNGVIRFKCTATEESTGKTYWVDNLSKSGSTADYGSGAVNVTKSGNTNQNRTVRQIDSDGDGVANDNDSCPSTHGGGNANGCPTVAPPPPPPPVTPPSIPAVSTGCSGSVITATATWTDSQGGFQYHFDIDNETTENNWSNGAWYKSVGNTRSYAFNSSTSFSPWGGRSGNLNLANSTTYKVRLYKFGSEGSIHSGTGTFKTPKCGGTTSQPQQPQQPQTPSGCGSGTLNDKCPPPKKTTSSSSRTVARTPTGPVNSSDSSRPTTPENFKAEQLGGGEVELAWDASTDNIAVSGYTLERSTDQEEWTMLDDAVIDTVYSDFTADFDTAYTYRLSAKDTAGNFSDYALVDITTNEFTANVTPDEETTISSEDGIVEATFPAGALTEDAFCEINKDSLSRTPKGYKLAAGEYSIVCRNAAGDTIDTTEEDVNVVMHLEAYLKKYSKFAAYSVGDELTIINSTFNEKTGDLEFNTKDLQPFAAFGAKKGSSWWIWVLLLLLVAGIVFLIKRLRNGGGSDDYYDTTDYVSMPPSAPVGPLDTGANGYQHHPSLPELVAQGGQPQQPNQPGPGQQPPLPPPPPPQQPPLPPQ